MRRRSGFAEVIKHALIQDQSFYNWLKDNIASFRHYLMRKISLHFLREELK